jgi:hypothetical protein
VTLRTNTRLAHKASNQVSTWLQSLQHANDCNLAKARLPLNEELRVAPLAL